MFVCTEYYYFVVKLDNMAIPIGLRPVILLFYTDGPLPKFNIILTRPKIFAYMFMILTILLAQAYMFTILMILSALDTCGVFA